MKIRRVKATPINYRLEGPLRLGLRRARRLDFVENGPCNKYHDPEKPGNYRRLPLN